MAAFSRRMFMVAGRTVNWRNNGPQNGEPRRQRPKCKMSNRAAHAAFSGKTNSAADQSLRHILLTLRPSSRSALGIPAEVIRRRLTLECRLVMGIMGRRGIMGLMWVRLFHSSSASSDSHRSPVVPLASLPCLSPGVRHSFTKSALCEEFFFQSSELLVDQVVGLMN